MVIIKPTQTQRARQIIDGLVAFCRSDRAAHCFRGWPVETVRAHLEFHIRHRTLSWVQTFGKPCGLLIAWRCRAAEICAADAEHGCVRVGRDDASGDAVFIGDVVCGVPGALPSLMQAVGKRLPGWERLRVFTYRRGKLREFKPGVFTRLLQMKGQPI